MAYITDPDIARGFNSDLIGPRVHLSECLTDHWDTLSLEDKYLVTQYVWDGFDK